MASELLQLRCGAINEVVCSVVPGIFSLEIDGHTFVARSFSIIEQMIPVSRSLSQVIEQDAGAGWMAKR